MVYFVNSGSEANDMALMLARLCTRNTDIISLHHAYHGLTYELMGTCGVHTWKHAVPQGHHVRHAPAPHPYRGLHGNHGPKYAESVRDIITYATSGSVAGFIAESIQGVGGFVPLADGYLQPVYEAVRRAGGVCIADEV